MLLPKNIKTSSSHPSAVSSRKHCSEGHCGMPSSTIKCPSLSPDPPSSCPFCPHSATIPTHSVCLPGRSHVNPNPNIYKYVWNNVTRIVQSWLTQSSAAQKHHPLTGQSQFQLDSSLLLPQKYLFFKTIMNLTALVRPEPSFEWKNTNVKS